MKIIIEQTDKFMKVESINGDIDDMCAVLLKVYLQTSDLIEKDHADDCDCKAPKLHKTVRANIIETVKNFKTGDEEVDKKIKEMFKQNDKTEKS